MNNSIRYSIIIPHHDTPALLQKCIESIPERDDIEVIIIDDDSDPSIVDFDNFPGTKRQNTHIVFDKDAKGAGHARNVGLSIAQGKWLIFADSDDFFDTDILNSAMDKYQDSSLDLVFFHIRCLDVETIQPRNNADKLYFNFIDSKKDRDNRCRFKIMVPWGKFVKREIVIKNNIQFDETKVGNDAWFSLQVGYNAQKVAVDDFVIYNWMVREGSITSHKNLESVMIHFNLATRMNRFKESHGLSQYRTNLFAYIPMLHRAGMSYVQASKLSFVKTSKRHLLMDLFNLFKTFIRK